MVSMDEATKTQNLRDPIMTFLDSARMSDVVRLAQQLTKKNGMIKELK